MLLNAANVVTAAERCKAIDKTGRIPINFLLSCSTDLDDHVKDQLQQLAATSSTISILPHSPVAPSSPVHDAVMTDVASPTPHAHLHDRPRYPHRRISDDPRAHHPNTDDDDERLSDIYPVSPNALHHSQRALRHDHREDDEDEALKDIDRETSCPDRNIIRRNQKRNQTLTRKAIRKHTGGNKVNAKEKSSNMDTSSTRNTLVGSDGMQSSVASSASQQSNTPRRRWKEWEDELLMKIVADKGPTRWNNLAESFPGRNGRQVRLRWMNHLQPSLDKRPWRPEEDAVLLEAHKALGNKWALISMKLGGRTDNSVKNRYKSIVRRNAREAKMARKQE